MHVLIRSSKLSPKKKKKKKGVALNTRLTLLTGRLNSKFQTQDKKRCTVWNL